MTREEAIQQLRETLSKIRPDSADELYRMAVEIRDAKNAVLQRYQPVFAPQNVQDLTAEEFRSFLLFRNNRHWDHMHRQGGWMTEDMDRLQQALAVLVDENRSLRDRLDTLRPNNSNPMVKGLGRAVITAILQVAHPDKYGVLNNIAEAGMTKLDLWPEMPRGASFGERYDRVNSVLLELGGELGVDLWTLDMLWWRVVQPEGEDDPDEEAGGLTDVEIHDEGEGLLGTRFGLERHLHEFMEDNWDQTELGRDWQLLEEDGDIVGSRYNTGDVGEIDMLAKHRSEDRWLVIELKRGQTSDATVGQLLRYMGWVRRRKAEEGQQVEGLIICRDVDTRLQYALDGQANVRCMTYQVSFALNEAPNLE